MNITSASFIKQKEGFVTSDMDGELVMLSVEHGKYFNLGTIGGEIWKLAAGEGKTISDIVATLTSEYEITATQCEREVIDFVTHMSKEGIVIVG
jgi:hypothetical protein